MILSGQKMGLVLSDPVAGWGLLLYSLKLFKINNKVFYRHKRRL